MNRRYRPGWPEGFAILGLGLAAACTGTIAGTSGDGAGPPGAPTGPGAPVAGAPPAPGERITNVGDIAASCQPGAGPAVGFLPLRRLNRLEYANTVRDLLGVEAVVDGFVLDSSIGTFHSNIDVHISELQTDQYRIAAENVAGQAIANIASLVSCDPASGEACAATFIRDFGLRAFRRPLSAEEQASYLEVYRAGTPRGGFNGGIRLVIRALLQSPHFLYLVERTPVGHATAAPLGPYELASRLSYMLWASTPDPELLSAASGGQLGTPEQLRAQAARLLDDPRAKGALGQFQLEWLQLGGIDGLEKDLTLFPSFTVELKQAMKGEVADFLDSIVQKPDGSFAELLTAPYAMLQGPLFQLYGVSPPATVPGPQRVDFAAGERSGILTEPLFLATHSHPNQGSPFLRGVVVRQAMLCQDLPPPPPDVDNAPPAPNPNLTTRQRFAAHSESPACKGCHSLIDGIGFGFERYDAVGAYRDSENGAPIDDSGHLINASPEVEGPFRGPVELGQKLAKSQVAQTCFVTQWFRFAYKREPLAADACTANGMIGAFASSSHNLRELVLSAVATDAFRHGVGEP